MAQLHRISSIRFHAPTSEDIVRSSVCAVTSSTVYERNLPKADGVNDTRMGTVDRRLRCGTCRLDLAACQGHHGHLALAAPAYHPYFVEHVYKTLRMVCYFCSAVLTSTSGELGKEAFKALAKRSARPTRCCGVCGCPQPAWARVKTAITLTWPEAAAKKLAEQGHGDVLGLPFTPYHAWLILRRITATDAAALGYEPTCTHPEALVLRTLVVPPPCIRPSIMASAGSRNMGMDDITVLLNDIVKANAGLAAVMAAGGANDDYVGYLLSAPSAEHAEAAARLQEAIDVYIREDPASVANGRHSHGNTKRRNLAQRLKGKEGRVRANLSGKRVDFSARTVISPEAELDIDELGVPEHVALTLTTRETVCAHNRDSLWRAILAGPRARGGARAVIYQSGVTIRLDTCTMRERLCLSDGDVVERTLRDGDWAVFNRQPTLHRLSMLGFRTRIMPGRTFRLPVPVTTGFNADFDGDEMNFYCPQDVVSRVEVAELMGVAHHMVTAQNSEVITSLKQDSLLGMFLLTRRGVAVPWAVACQLVMALRYARQPLGAPGDSRDFGAPGAAGDSRDSRGLVSGAAVFSVLLPPTMNFEHRGTRITSGRLATDGLTKGVVKALVHYFWMDSHAAAAGFVSDMQRLANAWLRVRGMSVGIADCVPVARSTRRMAAMDGELHTLYDQIHVQGTASGVAGDALEPVLSSLLSGALNYAGQVCQDGLAVTAEPAATNNILAMVASGSKGSMLNIGQIMGVIGQQYVRGARIKHRLPCFPRGDNSMEARGYVAASYLRGMRPAQYFHHAMGGREGLVDTAVRTSESGYMHRKLMKGMESARVAYDGTVRNSQQEVVQYVYGGDGFDAARLVKSTLPLVLLSDGAVAAAATEVEAPRLLMLRDTLRAACRLTPWRRQWSDVVYTPFHGPWVLDSVGGASSGAASGTPGAASGAASESVDALAHAAWMDGLVASVTAACNNTLLPPLEAYVRWHFRAGVTGRLPRKALRRLTDKVTGMVARARVAPAEMVGALAAQSCGEPTTQLTLNSFHTSGVLHDITQGVPRLKELLNVTPKSKPKTPVMTVALAAPFSGSAEYAAGLAHTMPEVMLHALVTNSEVARDAPLTPVDYVHARMFPEYGALLQRRGGLARHTLVFTLDTDAMVAYELTPALLAARIHGAVTDAIDGGTPAFIVAAAFTDEVWRVSVRFAAPPRAKRARAAAAASAASSAEDPEDAFRDEPLALQELQRRLLNIRVCGIAGIASAQVARATTTAASPDGGTREVTTWQVVTRGINLLDAADVASVDSGALVCNDVVGVAELYGLEAAAKVLFHEIRGVLCSDATALHDRHIMMVVDTMTMGGALMPMNRHGLNKRSTGPLVRSSFEQTVDVFNEAAVFGERDTMSGVSENVMAGQLAPLGTGYMEVLPSGSAHGSAAHGSAAHGSAAPGFAADDDVVFSTLGDQLDAAAVQYDPCLPALVPGLEAPLPSLGADPGSPREPGWREAPEFVYRPRSPARETVWVYAPRSPAVGAARQ